MTDPTIELIQHLINRRLEKDADIFRQAVQLLNQMLMEHEVEQQIGDGKHERTPLTKTLNYVLSLIFTVSMIHHPKKLFVVK